MLLWYAHKISDRDELNALDKMTKQALIQESGIKGGIECRNVFGYNPSRNERGWWWPTNKVSLGNSASSRLRFDQTPANHLANNISPLSCYDILEHIFRFFVTIIVIAIANMLLLRKLAIMWILVGQCKFAEWPTLVRFVFQNSFKWPPAPPPSPANHTMLTTNQVLGSVEICFGEILVKRPCPCLKFEALVWSWSCLGRPKIWEEQKRRDGVKEGRRHHFPLLQTTGKHSFNIVA